jgi:drug/metabolite transporter (DMT)-like permease
MTPLGCVLLAFNFLIDTFGQLSFKAAALRAPDEANIKRWQVMLSNYWIWGGVLAFVFEFFVWIAFLTQVPLAVGVLMSSLNILSIVIGGRIFFGEKLSRKRLMATVLIASGVLCVGFGGG